MEIKKHIRDNSEPIPCERCRDDFNGLNYIWLELFKDFILDVNLCDNCLNDLKSSFKSQTKENITKTN